MTETTLQMVQFLKLIWLAGFALLYGLGGIDNKWIRRVGGSIFLAIGVIGFSLWTQSYSHWLLFYAPLLFASLTLGYSGDDAAEKVTRRMVYGLAVGFAAFPIAIATHLWLAFAMHMVVCMCVSLFLGVFNPTKSARAEESMVGFVIGFMPLIGMI